MENSRLKKNQITCEREKGVESKEKRERRKR